MINIKVKIKLLLKLLICCPNDTLKFQVPRPPKWGLDMEIGLLSFSTGIWKQWRPYPRQQGEASYVTAKAETEAIHFQAREF